MFTKKHPPGFHLPRALFGMVFFATLFFIVNPYLSYRITLISQSVNLFIHADLGCFNATISPS